METNIKARMAGTEKLAGLGAGLAIAAALIGLGLEGWRTAVGAIAGSSAAILYTSSYVRSHLGRMPRERMLSGAFFFRFLARITLLIAMAAAVLAADRAAFLSFVITFAVVFPALLLSQATTIARSLRSAAPIDNGRGRS